MVHSRAVMLWDLEHHSTTAWCWTETTEKSHYQDMRKYFFVIRYSLSDRNKFRTDHCKIYASLLWDRGGEEIYPV